MAKRDYAHQVVRRALEKDGWTITHDPLIVSFGRLDLQIDLGAEKLLAAERAGRQIAVEIKGFISPSPISEFHTALGQFLNYRIALEQSGSTRDLYLAVPLETYDSFFTEPITDLAVQRYQIALLIYDAREELIVTWKP